ncbi:MerR family transcriptional regulator [Rummeliibacillus sp. NPDC094406]|uniref:helix-turn-helix domain-containing protein n=1 Tax=Rummeliibacillus sp. NPDC094406 TaxID=3364511 RepID=UPI00381BC25B
MKYFQSGEVADILNISTGSLRSYAQLLEHVGYEFKKNVNKQRQYSDHDVNILSAMLALKNEHGLALKDAVDKVSSADFAPSSVLQTIAEHQSELPSVLPNDIKSNEFYQILELLTNEMVALKGENQELKALISAQNGAIRDLENKQDRALKAIEHPQKSPEFKHMEEQLDTMLRHQTTLAETAPNTNFLTAEIRILNSKIAELETLATTDGNKGGFWSRLFKK